MKLKRIVSLLLSMVMILCLLPTTVGAAELAINGNKIDIDDKQVGPYTLKYLEVYLQDSYAPVSIISAEQNDTRIDIVLSADTDPSAKLQAGLSGTGSGTLQHKSNKCTLENGAGTMTYEFQVTMGPQPVAGGSYTINFTTEGPSEPAVKFTTNLSDTEVKYVRGKSSTPLTVSAKYVGGETESTVTYQWYKNTEKDTENGEAIDGATQESFTPDTDEIGTTYYYVIASCEGLTVTSKITTVTIEAPSLKILTNPKDAEYIQGKTAIPLTFDVEYTGITENTVVYQWYKNSEESTDNGEAIDGVTDKSFTPATDEIGTTYYYATASCEGLTVTSSVATITVTEIPVLDVTDNVIDITDKTVYSRSSYYAKAINIKIDGAGVEKATEDDTTVNIVLDGTTSPSAEISVEFGTSLNRCTMSGHTGTVKLNNGEAQLVMTLTGQYASSLKGSQTYTLNFSLGEAPEIIPERKTASDNKETYNGIEVDIDLNDYFNFSKYFYLVENGEKTPLESNIYTFKTDDGGTYTLVFGASNDVGDCPDYVTVTVEVTEIESGLWLGVETSNGSVNFVRFSDEGGNEIEGLAATLEDKNIIVTLPRSFGANSKITATFDLTQTSTNDGDMPFISGSNAFNQGVGKTTAYTSTLSNGVTKKTLYLYNSKPTAVNNSPESYTISYAIKNKNPILAESQDEPMAAEIVAGESFTLDLAPIFTDADGDALTYSVEINGEEAVTADADYSFTPTIGGKIYTLEFFASDFMSRSQQSYKVTLTVVNSTATYDMTVSLPSDITPAFYITNGYENGVDVLGNELEFIKGDTVDGIACYTVSVPENISEISVRDQSYGGMAFSAESGSTVTLQKIDTGILDFGDKVIHGVVSVSYGEHNAVGIDGKFLLVAETEYTFSATPENTSKYSTKSDTIILGADVSKVSIKVAFKNPKTIKTTTGADAKLFRSSGNYFVYTVYEPEAVVDNGDGTSTHYFAPEDSSRPGVLSYRISMDGKLTKAGYLLLGNSATVLYGEADKLPADRVDYTTAGTDAAEVGDDSVLLNINQQNHLSLTVGETKTLKAYRTWQIITYSYENHIIEPDFHFNIISGDNVIKLEPIANQPTTNSSGNWQRLTAVGEGTAVVEVTYDAIDVNGGSYEGFYGATDPARTGLFVVTVGTEVPDIDFGIECKASAGSISYKEQNAKPWDAEFDTLYFLGEKGEIKLSPSFANGSITEVAVSGDKGDSYTVLEEANGVYTAPVVSGNNIIRVTTDNGVAYQIVRGDKVELVVKNESNSGKPIDAGDEVSVMLVGVHTPIPKIAGTYNPGYADNTDGESRVHLRYSFGDETVISEGKQYTFSLHGTTLKFTVPEDSEENEFTLTDGYIGVGVIGVTAFPDDGKSHRNIPDAGDTTRGNTTTFHTRSLLPDITLSIGMLPSDNTAPYIRENAPETATLNLGSTYAISMSKVFIDRENDDLTFTAKVNGNEEALVEDGYYTFTPDSVGTYVIEFTANDGTFDSDIHTVTLTVKEKQNTSSPSIEFDVDEDDIAGYVKVSFEDKGKRVDGEENITYPKALGTIISTRRVPFMDGDTVADVTLRLLDAYGFTYEYTGTTKDGFYLASIGDFTLKGINYDSFGEFDAGEGSGWMITLNNDFIEYGASDFEVESGDVIKWQYTCRLGADIGDPFWDDDDYTPVVRPSKPKDEDDKEDKETEDKNEDEPKPEEVEKLGFTETTFNDVGINDWYYESVKYVYENRIMQGTDIGFEPESKMTRAMLVTVLYRLENSDGVIRENTFTDVANGEWYTEAVIWAKENGIVTGVTETVFAPNDNVTREQVAAIIYRYAKFKGCDVNSFISLFAFSDADDISGYAASAMSWACETGIIRGTTATTLSPKDTTTRAQVATILMRFCKITAN